MRLDFNENTLGCSPRVLDRLRTLDAAQLARYPERTPLESITAQYLRIQPEEVLLTNGIDEAIHLLCETYLDPADQVLIPVPTFAMYEVFAAATGATIRNVQAGAEFTFPEQDLRTHITERTKLIVIANPNNPTGVATRREVILDLARSAPHAAILVDEAYFEFFGHTLLPEWKALPNLFVARTFSKAYGLAALRVGVLLGDPIALSSIRRVASPYSVNGVALACLPAALADDRFVQEYAAQVRSSRERLQAMLGDWGIKFWPSEANFVLVHVGARHEEFVASVRARGILVRDRSHDPGCDGCVRITVGTAQQTDQLLQTLADAFTQIGLLNQGALR
jgi:histidinol-phosphate aminotransferase